MALLCQLLIHQPENVTIRRFPGRDHSLMNPDVKQSGPPRLQFLDDVLKWAEKQ
jgi:hypothetical protein